MFGEINLAKVFILLTVTNLFQLLAFKKDLRSKREIISIFDIQVFAKSAISILPLFIVYLDRVLTSSLPIEEYSDNSYLITIGSGLAIALTKIVGYKVQFEKKIRKTDIAYIIVGAITIYSLSNLFRMTIDYKSCATGMVFCNLFGNLTKTGIDTLLLYILLFSAYGIVQRYFLAIGNKKLLLTAAIIIFTILMSGMAGFYTASSLLPASILALSLSLAIMIPMIIYAMKSND